MKVVNGINEVFGKFQNQLDGLKELASSVVELLGVDTVSAVVEKRKLDRETKEADSAKTQVDKLVLEGGLVAVEKVESTSFIVGREFTKEGTLRHPGRVQVQFKDLRLEFQPKFEGQPVGVSIETEDLGRFEIQEIYSIVDVPVTSEITETK